MASGDVSLKYGTYQTITISPAALASSTTFSAGRESTAVVKSDPEIDHIVTGKIRVGTSPTANKMIQIWFYAQFDDTPAYPDVFDGTDSAETVTSENVRNAALRGPVQIIVDNTSDRDYWIAPTSVAMIFGGVLPKRWGLFIAHDTGVNLNATAGNHSFKYQPVYMNVAP